MNEAALAEVQVESASVSPSSAAVRRRIPEPAVRPIEVGDLLRGLKLLAALPSLLRRPIDPGMARAILRQRLENRETDFLSLARRGIYAVAASPYRRLLSIAGCEYGDLERLVGNEGVDGALRVLAGRGVFLTVDEFKGRGAVTRGSNTFEVDPEGLNNPGAASHLAFRSSGSRGAGTPVAFDIAHFRDHAVNTHLSLTARQGLNWQHGLWIVPGGAAMVVQLQYAALGRPPVAWFSQVDPRSPALDPRYLLSACLLRWGSRLSGTRLPPPVHAPLRQPENILSWVRNVGRGGQIAHLLTFPSSAMELCRAALAAGVDLRGTQLSIGGEPITRIRLEAIRSTGAEARPHYGCMEAGIVSEGCLSPVEPDDVHLFDDIIALISVKGALVSGPPTGSVLISSLRPTAPMMLLNVSLGDRAVLETRSCGCPLEELGWTKHLHTIRSFEKLTAAGMTLLDTSAVVALEQVLPARFGGSPTDFQLLEEEDERGRPRLVIRVSPSVGAFDEQELTSLFLTTIGAGPGAARIAELFWRDAALLRVERRQPEAVSSGKVLHLVSAVHSTPSAGPPDSSE